MIIAVDFDGTLCEHVFPEIGKPIIKVIKFIQKAKKDGHTISLWTCRENTEARKFLQEALDWCKEQEIPIDYANSYPNTDDWAGFDRDAIIPCRKIFADIYIDDRALHIKDIYYKNNWDKWGDRSIPKDHLIAGNYYAGVCRNANIARWDGEKFIHWREKFNSVFLEDIEYWDLDGIHDGFIPLFNLGTELPQPILGYQNKRF